MAILLQKSGGSRARDPWVTYFNKRYYYVLSDAEGIYMASAEKLQDLHCVAPKRVYNPKLGGAYSKEIWAPELHIIDNKCYIYVAMDDGNNYNHRMFALSNNSDDPFKEYAMCGKITDSSDKWAIDGTSFRYGGKRYFVWSGWEGNSNVCQNLYIAPMSDPITISGERVMISRPELEWEKRGSTGVEGSPFINEGPCALQKDGRLFILFSASGSWCNDYCIGMLEYTGGDLLSPDNWKKHSKPVFSGSGEVKGPGHCSVTEDSCGNMYICYHAFCNIAEAPQWKDASAIAQRFEFSQGLPYFGSPEDTLQNL